MYDPEVAFYVTHDPADAPDAIRADVETIRSLAEPLARASQIRNFTRVPHEALDGFVSLSFEIDGFEPGTDGLDCVSIVAGNRVIAYGRASELWAGWELDVPLWNEEANFLEAALGGDEMRRPDNADAKEPNRARKDGERARGIARKLKREYWGLP